MKNVFIKTTILVMSLSIAACGGSGGNNGDEGSGGQLNPGGNTNSPGTGNGATSNRARFTFDCDLQGVNGELTLDIEAVQGSGITWGSGTNPDITGVISDGSVNYFTDGEVRSNIAYYTFTGENQFADFVDMNNGDRFRVQWVEESNGLTIVVNPFGPQPGRHFCTPTGSEFL